MNDEPEPDLQAKVDRIYEDLLIRPGMFAGQVECFESFVYGVEMVLDRLAAKRPRPDSYREFLRDSNFGARGFTSTFGGGYRCLLSFIPKSRAKTLEKAFTLRKVFEDEFKVHWTRFLAWRAGRRAT